MADRYRTPVPVLKTLVTFRDLQEFIEWERENPSGEWWAEATARANGVKFARTPKITTGDDSFFLNLAKGSGVK